MRRFFASLLRLALPFGARGQEQPVSLEGRWRLDLAKSVNPYKSGTKAGTITIRSDNGEMFESSEEVIKEDGAKRTFSMWQPVDGKFYPVVGMTEPVMAAVTDRTPGRVRIELRAGGLRAIEVCQRQANTLICSEIVTDTADGQTYGKAVYKRLPQSN